MFDGGANFNIVKGNSENKIYIWRYCAEYKYIIIIYMDVSLSGFGAQWKERAYAVCLPQEMDMYV